MKESGFSLPGAGEQFRAEAFHFGELLKIVHLRRKFLYVFTAMILLGAVVKHFLYVPTFTASTQLLIQNDRGNRMQMTLANLGLSEADTIVKIEKYLFYLNSPQFYLAVAEALKFKDGYHLLNLMLPSQMAPTEKAFWVYFLNQKFGKKIHVSQTDQKPEPVLVPVEELATIIGQMVNAKRSSFDTIDIYVTSLDPFTSMVLANTIADVFVEKTRQRDFAEVSEVKKFIEDQLEDTTRKLKKSELELVDFKKNHGMVSIKSGESQFSNRLATLDSELENVKIKLKQSVKLQSFYSEKLKERQKELVSTSPNSKEGTTAVLSRLRKELETIKYRKVLMLTQGYDKNSWQMKQSDKQITDLQKRIKEMEATTDGVETPETAPMTLSQIQTRLAGLAEEKKNLETKEVSLVNSRKELMKTLEVIPKDEQNLLKLTREVDLQFELFSTLKKKLQEVEIQRVALQSKVLVSRHAQMPGPSARVSILLKILFSLLVGMFLGSVAAFLFEVLDPTVKFRSDLEELQMVTLGTIPHIEGHRVRKSLGNDSFRPDLLICREDPESPESMAFKHVRTQLVNMRNSQGEAAKIITVTSAERGDGKSFFSSNIAVALSQLEKKTIVIDCDFRNPSLPWFYGFNQREGLSALLSLKASLDEVLVSDISPNLDILPAGWLPSNPTELLSNDKFRFLLDHLKETYAYIVLDSTPALSVVDAAILANLSDVVLMVAGYRKTRKQDLMMALKKIMQITHKHVYSVLNNVWEWHEYTDYNYTYYVTPNAALRQRKPENVDLKDELKRFEDSLKKKAS